MKRIIVIALGVLLGCSSAEDESASCSNSEATCSDGTSLQVCSKLRTTDYSCIEKSYKVRSQTFRCTTCDDCISALNAAMKVCRP